VAEPLQVLIVEDSDRDAAVLVAELRRADFDPASERVWTEAAYRAALNPQLDIVLVDAQASPFGPSRALDALRTAGLGIPLIVVSATPRAGEAAQWIEQGAADCVARSALGRLGRAVSAARERKALRELQESEERTRLILDNALDAVITIDIEGRVIGWSPQAERLFGWQATEILHRRLSETIIPPAYRDAHEHGLARFRAAGEGPALNRRIELSALRRDGTLFPVELAITPVRLKGATVFSAFLRDITERKRAEEMRQHSEARFRLLFASNPLPMWVYDTTTLNFLEVNEAAIGHYGYSRDEFLSMRVTDIRPPEDVPRFNDFLAEIRTQPDTAVRQHVGLWRHRLKDGRIRNVDIASHFIDFAGQRASLVVAIDVTELKQAEAALAKASERLRILHGIDRAIIAAEEPAAIAKAVLPPLRELLDVPRAIVNLFDWAAGEVEWLAAVGRRRLRVGPGVRYPLALAGDLEALRRGEPQVIDVDSLPPSPETEGLLTSGVHVYMVVPMIAGGQLIGSISFGGARGQFAPEQISIAQEVAAQLAIALAQARLHEQVKRQAEELEQRVRERTLELKAANGQLEQEIAERRRAEADADRANRAKSEFLSRMSHELRTPLNAILGFAQILEMSLEKPREQECLTQILKGGRHLLSLVNEVLDIAGIEAGRVKISPEAVELGQVIGEVLELGRPLAAPRRIEFQIDGAQLQVQHVLADKQRLKQVLLNLVANAIKYNRIAGTVTVSCREVPSDRLRISVSDTGPGIPHTMQARLFRAFERLGVPESEEIEGTGLGLALSKGLVELMGGSIGVHSVVGEGSTFWVELPRTLGPVERQARTGGAPAGEPTSTHTGTVLYIEDNLSNIRLLEHVMERRPGVKLLSALQGRLGLELARQHHPDVILLDLHLPDVSGEDVLRELRGDSGLRRIPVIVVSADATQRQIERLLAAGARSYLTKPLDVRLMLGLLDKILDGSAESG
jgi:PAS domain S-box-containing protein